MNANMPPVRLIDELGRIVLPVEARRIMDWGEKAPVEIWVNAIDHEIIIKQHIFACAYCGATDNLKEYQKKHICLNCQKAIADL